ncbi:MAG TPA: bacillithiol biosynthesis cysteine-adding enzyme BshC [Pyrinomonadaceae bacterium]|nr:bacillithiol biosynthesis cysteine-adding enzyme BshC [Pyrinomonadaceae bacterium]
MSTAETACHASPEQAGLRLEAIPFAEIPQQSPLFLDYLRQPAALRRFYPEAVEHHFDLAQRRDHVLQNYRTDRKRLCDALGRMNRAWGAGEKTFEHIATLREPDSIAVVTGQQAGLLGGPLYTIYKALSAVKLAECLTLRGVKAVPVFWIATEDHDFEEVASAEFIDRDCQLSKVSVPPAIHLDGLPVGQVQLDDSIANLVQELIQSLPQTEFSDELRALLNQSYTPQIKFSDAFARLMARLTATRGLILLDPLDAELKQMAAPLYAEAAARAGEIAQAIVARSRELTEAGYHAQVTPSENSFPLFLHDENGTRQALTRNDSGRYQTKTTKETEGYTAEDLAEWARREPARFSPNVTSRAVVQDYLLPTIAYFGGAAEIAYFAQTSEVYRILNRPATPILARASLTLVEKHTWRSLQRYQVQLRDFFAGIDHVKAQVVTNYLGKETSAAFERTTETFNKELADLQEQLRRVDPTLAEALDKGRRKINYQIDGLRTRFNRAQVARDEAVERQLEHAFDLLYPQKALQERHINISSFIARHGMYFIDWIFDAIDLQTRDHEVIYL